MLSTFIIPNEAGIWVYPWPKPRTQIPRFARNDNKRSSSNAGTAITKSAIKIGSRSSRSSIELEVCAPRPALQKLSPLFTGQSVSLVGTWMTQIATSWLVYRLTGSAWLLGIVGFASRIPTFFLAPFAGVWIDRWNRHHTLVVTQILSMLQSFALAWLALARIITIREVIWLGLAQGVINAIDMPARQAFVIEMVEERTDLGNAIALNSSMVNAARLLGPSIAGVIIAAVGEAIAS